MNDEIYLEYELLKVNKKTGELNLDKKQLTERGKVSINAMDAREMNNDAATSKIYYIKKEVEAKKVDISRLNKEDLIKHVIDNELDVNVEGTKAEIIAEIKALEK